MSEDKHPRIFLIGFNKCGTTSFHDYFKANNISSVHWRANTLALALHRNLGKGATPLEGIDRMDGLHRHELHTGLTLGRSNSDSAPLIEGCRYFRELHREYPDSRSSSTHVTLLIGFDHVTHDKGLFATAYLRALANEGIHTRQQLKRRWLQDWYVHHAEVLNYFQSNAPRQFLLFHIQATSARKLNRFLKPHFEIKEQHFPIITNQQNTEAEPGGNPAGAHAPNKANSDRPVRVGSASLVWGELQQRDAQWQPAP